MLYRRLNSCKIASACRQQTLHFSNLFGKPRNDGDTDSLRVISNTRVSVIARPAIQKLNHKEC